jgi:hypothetical protein
MIHHVRKLHIVHPSRSGAKSQRANHGLTATLITARLTVTEPV